MRSVVEDNGLAVAVPQIGPSGRSPRRVEVVLEFTISLASAGQLSSWGMRPERKVGTGLGTRRHHRRLPCLALSTDQIEFPDASDDRPRHGLHRRLLGIGVAVDVLTEDRPLDPPMRGDRQTDVARMDDDEAETVALSHGVDPQSDVSFKETLCRREHLGRDLHAPCEKTVDLPVDGAHRPRAEMRDGAGVVDLDGAGVHGILRGGRPFLAQNSSLAPAGVLISARHRISRPGTTVGGCSMHSRS